MQVSTLPEEQYTDFVFGSFIVTVMMAILCILIQLVLIYLPWHRTQQAISKNQKENQSLQQHHMQSNDPDEDAVSNKYLSPVRDEPSDENLEKVESDSKEETNDLTSTIRILLALLLVVIFVLVTVLWTILVTTHHRTAVEHLMMQLANSTDTALGASLTDAQKMLKQAHNIWQFTGKLHLSHYLSLILAASCNHMPIV